MKFYEQFNQVIQSYGMTPFSPSEFMTITEIFDNLTEEDSKNLAEDYAKEYMTYEYETMYR